MSLSDPDLVDLGWRLFFDQQLSDDERRACDPVRVMAVHRGRTSVAGSGLERDLSPHLLPAHSDEELLAVGDWLLIDRGGGEAVRLLDRESLFKRRAPGKGRRIQLIAANVDTLFIVASCNRDFNIARLERYLVLAHDANVKPVIILTKTDLTDEAESFAEAARGLRHDLPVATVDARDPGAVGALAAWCGKGQTVALVGSSGVGKSTLVNSLRGDGDLATQAPRAGDDRGRHTTTVREMHRLDNGGWLLDTPGMRELQLSNAASGLAEFFDDIVALAQDCRFSNCTHQGEPACAVQDAVRTGALSAARLDRWRGLVSEDALNTREMDGRGSAPRQTRKRR